MLELIQKNGWKYESSLDNVTEELLWVKNQIQKELANLQQDIQENQIKKSFFDRIENVSEWNVQDEDTKYVEYHMDLVKEYLQHCIENENFQVNSAVVMAVQIALESLEKQEYDVWKIDWLLTRNSWKMSKTQKAIRQFQKDNEIHVDWFPWKETIQKILDVLWGEPQNLSASPEVEEKDNPVPEEETLIWTDKVETNKNVKIKLDKNGNVSNLQEILDASNLELPRLKASNVSEIWWWWDSIMQDFQWYWKNTDKHFTHMIWTPESVSTTTHIMKFKSEEHVKQYKEKNPHIKSFVLYFWWDASDNEQTLHDLANWAERLSNAEIQPVLCTCMGAERHITQEDGKALEIFNNDIRNIVNESKWKYKLIDFAKVDDVIETWDNKKAKSYALMHDIIYKCIEK